MKISQIDFYKVPIDSSYKNVFDGYNSYKELDDFLGNVKLTINGSRSIQIKGLNASIDIKAIYPYSDDEQSPLAFDFNYCCVSGYKNNLLVRTYYFIESITTLNDSQNSTIRLSLLYDCWTNNYLAMKYYRQIGHIIDRHRNKYIDTVTPTGHSRYIEVDFKDELVTPKKEWIVIFRFFRYQKDGIEFVEGEGTPTVFPNEQETATMFVPWCAYNVTSGLLTFNVNLYGNGYATFVTRDFQSTRLIDSWYSAIGIEDYTTLYDSNLNFVSVQFTNGTGYYPKVKVVHDSTISGYDGYVTFTNLSYNDIYQILIERPKPPYDTDYDSGTYSFPNFKRYVCIGDKKILVTFPKESTDDVYFEITRQRTSMLRYRFKIGEKYTDFVDINVPFNAVTSYDTFRAYLESNKNSMMQARITSAAGAVTSAASAFIRTGSPLSLEGIQYAKDFITGIRNDIALLRDLKNQPDSYNITGNDGSAYFRSFCDYPIIVDEIPFSEYERNVIDSNIKMYGYSVDEYDDVLQNFRTTFDFIKCADVSMHAIGNTEQRLEIENALSRGVRKWHINSGNRNDILALNYFSQNDDYRGGAVG